MKYNININQIKAIERKLTFAESVLVDLFAHLPTWAESKVIDNEVRYFFSKNKILEQVPILSEKGNIDTIYRQTKKLVKKGIVDFKKVGVKDYWKLNPIMRDWVFKSDSCPSQLGFSSEPTSDSRPINNNINNNNIKDNNNSAEELYNLYITKKPNGRRVNKKTALVHIGKIIDSKEYGYEYLKKVINNYLVQLEDNKFFKNPEKFFSTSLKSEEPFFFTKYEQVEIKQDKPIDYDLLLQI